MTEQHSETDLELNLDEIDLTADAGYDQLLEPIADTDLPPRIESLIDTYNDLVGLRDPFIWRWIYASVQPIRLSCVPEEYHDTVTIPKTIGMIYVTAVDDIADQLEDAQLLEAVARIQSRHADASDLDHLVRDDEAAVHLEFVQHAWEALETEIRDAPRAEEFWPFLEFDIEQMLMSMKYSMLLSANLDMVNFAEGLGHHSHSCAHFMAADIDLMYSPEFDRADLSPLRSLLWEGQQLHRLLNWQVTWERELDEDDVTSGVYAVALNEDVIDVAELERVQRGEMDPEVIRDRIRDADIEHRLAKQWEQQYQTILDEARAADTESVDLVDYVDGVYRICQNHLAAQGYI